MKIEQFRTTLTTEQLNDRLSKVFGSAINLDKLGSVKRLDSFLERDQEVIRNLIHKSLVKRIDRQGETLVVANGSAKTI